MTLDDYELVPLYEVVATVKSDYATNISRDKTVLTTDYFVVEWDEDEPQIVGYMLKPKESK